VKRLCLVFLLFPLLVKMPLEAQATGVNSLSPTDMNTLYAREEFRIGVQAYNRFAFNDAILSFEHALAYLPGEPLLMDWLGRAYYRSGLEATALRVWSNSAQVYGTSSPEAILLGSRIETVRNRRSLLPLVEDNVRYVPSGQYPGRSGTMVYFKQPTSILPLDDGSAWVVAYGSNELVRIDINGVIRQRVRGPINGFDRPYDIVRGLDGRMYVSEFLGGRVSILSSKGEWLSYIGSKGRENGMFVGPQNLAIDEEGYLYVVDYGNRRISKFDPDGGFILSFGSKTTIFPGILSPTGIAAKNGMVYVADNATKQIYRFDRNGIYQDIFVKEGLSGPESLRFLPDGALLVADTNRILVIELDSAFIRELGMAGNSSVRIVGADMDKNGNVLAANFQSDEVLVMTRFNDMAAGLFVQIDRVVTSSFPTVTLEVTVQDRLRRPIVGLDARNFLLTEEGRVVIEQSFIGAGYRANTADISVLIERSNLTLDAQLDMEVALRDIRANLSGNLVSLVSAGEQPLKEQVSELATDIARTARGNPASYSQNWRFDLGLRLAASDLLPMEKKRAVVFVGSGNLGELAFEQYSLSELASYLANNGIIFYAIMLGDNQAGEELRYLCNQTGGEVLSLYQPQGIGPVIRNIAAAPSGTYILSYRSQLATDFGRAYLPVEAEVYLMERSGRDSIGYFPPLE
jgi:DNA-binding beta-propeller fold protein YncE